MAVGTATKRGQEVVPVPVSFPQIPIQSLSAWKRLVDLVLTVGLLIVASPVILLCILFVRLTSRGPGLYSQDRVGLGGRVYRIFKIRTMVHNCERISGPQWSQAGDPRVTPLGRFLRRTHLDELPQLWNVLKGDMSLVGPRPERPEFIPRLAAAMPRYYERLQVRPGVTGLAQVQLPPDIDLDSVRRKLTYDLYYAERQSLWLDLRLILATAGKMFGLSFARTGKALRLPGKQAVEAREDSGEVVIAPSQELTPAWQAS